MLSLAVPLFSAPMEYAWAQIVILRYGQISSKIKTVSALHFYIAQRKALCAPRRDGDADPQLNRETGDQKLRRPQGQNRRVSLAADTIALSTRPLMALNGVKEAYFKVKELVGTPVRADCLKKGECDAVPLGQPEESGLDEARLPHGDLSIHRQRRARIAGDMGRRAEARKQIICSERERHSRQASINLKSRSDP
jgi:hypothetical protein